ncbi:MAG: hypothetical protein AB1297_04995 [bacterium]
MKSVHLKKYKEKDISTSSTFLLKGAFLFLFLLLIGFYEYKGFKKGGVGFPMDDPYIHLNLARSFSQGQGFSLNPPHQTATSTSFLWTVIISLIFLITKNPIIPLHILGIILTILASFILYLLSLNLFKSRLVAISSFGLFLLEWHTIWFAISGMEISLFVLLLLFSFLLFVKNGCSIKTGIFVGLLSITRPEGSILFFLFLIPFLYKKSIPKGYVLSFLLCISPVVLFNLIASGRPLPQTFYAKYLYYHQIMANPMSSFFVEVLKYFFASHLLVLAPFFLLSIFIYQNKEIRTMQGFFFLLITAYAIVIPHLYVYGRYIVPSIVILLLLGIKTAYSLLKKRFFYFLALCSLVFLCFAYLRVDTYMWWRNAITTGQVKAGKWLYSHTPKAARVASHDIGAIVYYGSRYIIDTLGLGTKETIPMFRDENALLRLLKKEKIDYIVEYPVVHPMITGLPPEELRLIRTFVVKNPLFSWTFCIWETSWGESHYYKGLGFLRNNDAKSAKDEFLKAVRINKEDFLSYFMLGDILKNQGDFKNALNYYKIGLENLKKLEKEGISVNREEIERIEAMVKSGSF